MAFEVEFDGTEARQPIVDGTYECKIEKIEDRKGEKGEYWNLTLIVANGTFVNRTIFTNVTFGEKAKWKLCHLLISAGIVETGAKGVKSFDSRDQMRNSLTGRNVFAKVQMREYNGQMRPEVANFVAGTKGNAPSPVTPSTLTSPVTTEAVPPAPVRPQL